MKSSMKISTLVLALCSLFSLSIRDHGVKSVKAAKGAGDENWGLVGLFADQITGTQLNWDQDKYDDIKFKYVQNADPEQARYELLYTFKAGNEFKIRLDNKWDVEIGYGGNEGGNISTYLSNSNGNFKVKEDGTYLLKIKDDNVAGYGDKSYGFSIEKKTTATFRPGDFWIDIADGHNKKSNIVKAIFTTNPSERKGELVESCEVGYSADQLTDDNYMIGMYLYYNEDDNTKYNCVFYANVDIIFANANSSSMFAYWQCAKTINFENYDTSRVTDMSYMFSECVKLENLDISSFNTSNVTNMENMFGGCESLLSLDISNFDTSNVLNMNAMFSRLKLTSLDVSTLNTEKVTDMSNMFTRCSSLTSLDLSNFNTKSVTKMGGMFKRCSSLKEVKFYNDPSNIVFDTSNVTEMDFMFSDCEALENLDISTFNTSKVEDMYYMFSGCLALKSINLTNFSTESARFLGGMFSMCLSLESIDVSSFNTTNVENMQAMFAMCPKLTSIDVSNFDTTNVVIMDGMFAYNEGLTSLDLSNFKTPNLETMIGMFTECPNLEKLDISNFDLSKVLLETDDTMGDQEVVSGVEYLFDGDTSLNYIKTPTAIRSELSIALPDQYNQVEGGVKTMDNTTVNMTLIPGSLELNKLYSDICKLDTCSEYSNATALRERYNALSEADKTIFADLSLIDQDKNGNNISLLANDKLAYMEYMLTLNSETEKNNIHIMTTINDNPSFLVIATIISSLAILGYYLIQKRKSSID